MPIHTVQSGETLSALAQRFGSSVEAIAMANDIEDPNLIFEDQVLCVPDSPEVPPKVHAYTVVPGDTLFRIAELFGTTVDAIVRANGIDNPNLIFPGDTFCVPIGPGIRPTRRHGDRILRGENSALRARPGEARFGFLFPFLPAFDPPDNLLRELANSMREPGGATAEELDNPNIPSGFTFLGQFLDHDITLDTAFSLERMEDPDALKNFRSPRYDLDSLYGLGPRDDPSKYRRDDPVKFFIANVDDPSKPDDLPRNQQGMADIGDGRNDENLIVAQLHLAFLKFHNAMVDFVREEEGQAIPSVVFRRAQRLTQWHYQWMVLTDFLPRTCGQEVVDQLIQLGEGRVGNFTTAQVNLEFYDPRTFRNPFMPLEFSVAAYRFGHSQVRPGYGLNATQGALLFTENPNDRDLTGSTPIPPGFEIAWEFFFDVPGKAVPPGRNRNQTRRIDTLLSSGLFTLPKTVVPDPKPGEPPRVASLAERNLIRGKLRELSSGQDVAKHMGFDPLSNEELGLSADPGWRNEAPLWYYVLKEAELQTNGERLGDVGGRIVAEVFVGLLTRDLNSFLTVRPNFVPVPPIAPAVGEFKMGDLLRFAGVT